MTDVVPSASSGSGGVVLLTGEIHIGKTTVCQSVIAEARRFGWRVAGLLSPTVFDAHGQRVAVEMIDLSTDKKRTLALLNQETEGPRVGPYHFCSPTLSWGHDVLTRAISEGCDLLVLDEIGRLELEQDAGLDVVPLLTECIIPTSLLVVRSSLLELFHHKLPGLVTRQFELTRSNRARAHTQVAQLLGLE